MHHQAMQQLIVHANEMQILRNKTKARGDNSLNFSTKLSETSPPLASIVKMGEKLRRPIQIVFLHILCISPQESRMQYTYPTVNTWRKTNYLDAQRLQQKDMPQRHNKERHKQSEDTN